MLITILDIFLKCGILNKKEVIKMVIGDLICCFILSGVFSIIGLSCINVGDPKNGYGIIGIAIVLSGYAVLLFIKGRKKSKKV